MRIYPVQSDILNTAADILSYAKTHDINLIAEDGQLKIDAPETALTDEFLESAKQHKSEILEVLTKIEPELMERVSDACIGLDMTPEQFIRVLNGKAKEQIISGELSASTLKGYAKQIDDAINNGVVNLIMEQII